MKLDKIPDLTNLLYGNILENAELEGEVVEVRIKKIVLYYLVLFLVIAGILAGIGDFLHSSIHRKENQIFHSET